MSDQKIVKIQLDERSVVRRNADIEHERAVAIFDLLEENEFAPAAGLTGPFHLQIGLEEGRLIVEIRDLDTARRLFTLLCVLHIRG